MSIEDFVWDERSDESVVEPSRPPGLLQRLRGSVWLEPALRIFGLALLLGVLSGIGIVASSYTAAGQVLPGGTSGLAAALGSSWLKPSGSAHAAAGPVGQPASGSSSAAAAAVETAVPTAEPPPSGSSEAPPPDGSGITSDGRIILNVASAEELTKLPGIGMKRAQAIVALRTKLKRFKRPSDLLRVKGIGPRSLQRMLPHLVLDPP